MGSSNQKVSISNKNLVKISLWSAFTLMILSFVFFISTDSVAKKSLSNRSLADEIKFELLSSHLEAVRQMDVALRGYAVCREDRFLFTSPPEVAVLISTTVNRLDSLLMEQDYTDEEGLEVIKIYQGYIWLLHSDFTKLSKLLKEGKDKEFLETFRLDKGKHLWPHYLKVVDVVIAHQDEIIKDSNENYEHAKFTMLVIQLLLLVIGIPAVIAVSVSLSKETRKNEFLVNTLHQNNKDYLFDDGTECGLLGGEIIESSINSLKQAASFVSEITKGNLETDWQGLSKDLEEKNKETLVGKLISLRNDLARIKEKDEKRFWVNQGLTEFAMLVRNYQNDLTELSVQTAQFLSKYTDAQQANLFIVNDKNGEVKLEMTACFAFNGNKRTDMELAAGESLVGQAFLDKEYILMTDVPNGYPSIKSGLGDATPGCILIMPFVFNQKVVAVFEMASFHVVEEHQIDFVKKAGEYVASAVVTAKNSEKTNALLEESKKQSQALSDIEEHLNQNIEELEAAQKEMKRSKDEIAKKESNLSALIDNTEDTMIALDSDYKISVVNKPLQEKYTKLGIPLKVGKHIHEVLPQAAWEVWKPKYDRCLKGESFTEINDSKNLNGETIKVQTSLNPIFDTNQNVMGISVISRDITEVISS